MTTNLAVGHPLRLWGDGRDWVPNSTIKWREGQEQNKEKNNDFVLACANTLKVTFGAESRYFLELSPSGSFLKVPCALPQLLQSELFWTGLARNKIPFNMCVCECRCCYVCVEIFRALRPLSWSFVSTTHEPRKVTGYFSFALFVRFVFVVLCCVVSILTLFPDLSTVSLSVS